MTTRSSYKIDVFNTLAGNLFWFFLMCFVITFFLLGATYINILSNSTERLIFMIVWCFSTIKLVIWCGHPQMSWRPREYEREQEIDNE